MERGRPRNGERERRRFGDDGRDGRRGVVLLDMVLTLAVLLLTFRIVWPLLSFETTPARQTAYAHEIAALLETDRVFAARRGDVVATRIDVRRRMITGGASGRTLTLPRDVVLEVITTTDCTVEADRFAIGFAPDGRSCGVTLALVRAGRTVRVSVNWLTGLVDVTGGRRG